MLVESRQEVQMSLPQGMAGRFLAMRGTHGKLGKGSPGLMKSRYRPARVTYRAAVSRLVPVSSSIHAD